MSVLSARRLDAPLDYRQLWVMLEERIMALINDKASKALQADDDTEIRRHQGAYRFGYTVLGEMEALVDDARKSNSPLRDARDEA